MTRPVSIIHWVLKPMDLRDTIITVCTTMDRHIIESKHLGKNKFFGQLVGVWPKQRKFMKYSTRIVSTTIMMVANITQIAYLIPYFEATVFTNQLPFLVLGVATLVKQYTYILNESKLNELLNGLVVDWVTEQPEEELKILQKYYKRTSYFSSYYTVVMYCSGLSFVLLPAVSPIMDIIAPLNETRPRRFIYTAYYFIDEEEYYYFITAHMVMSAFILISVFIACDLHLVHVVQHSCALFAISGYRFKHATDDTAVCIQKDRCGLVDKSYARVSRSIDAHKKAIKYVQMVDACHVQYFFLILGLVITALSVTFVKLVTMELCSEYITFCIFLAAQLTHLLFLTVMGQLVIDSNDEIFRTICEACWYNSPTKTQSLYVLVLRKCFSTPKLTGGGIVPLNLDSFLKVLKMSASYYTVLKSS